MNSKSKPKVSILMCTLNGEKFLNDQLNSIVNQDYLNWHLYVSDDGSKDQTVRMLEKFAKSEADRVSVKSGPQKGFVHNFLSLASDQEIDGDLFAFCDQDDIWLSNHLSRAIEFLSSAEENIPTLYAGRTRLISENGEGLGLSPLFHRPPSFRNAIVQSIAGANTMVFNRDTRKLLLKTKGAEPVSHDWWLYLLVTGSGGKVFYDREPTVLYRQHRFNIRGSNRGYKARKLRLQQFVNGTLKDWTECNMRALKRAENLLSKESLDTFETLKKIKKGNLFQRLWALKKSKIYRQGYIDNLAVLIASLIKKI